MPQTTPSSEFDVIIVGASLIGASCALSLAENTKLSIAVLEKGEQVDANPHHGLRVSALGNSAVKLLEQIDVWPVIPEKSKYPYQDMLVWDEHSDGELMFQAKDYQREQLGFIVDNTDCIIALQQQMVQHPQITTYYGVSLEQVKRDRSHVELDSAIGPFSAHLLIAADGNRSWVREQCAIKTKQFDYRQMGIVAVIETQKPHQHTAWQRFLQTGPVAILPVNDNACSIVWSVDSDKAKQLLELNDDEFCTTIEQALDMKLGKVTKTSIRMGFPLRSKKAEKYTLPNIALIGDAAHGIHPLAGQGANLGFKDVVCLNKLLAEIDSISTVDYSLLRKYERERKLDNEITDFTMSALYNVYQHTSPWFLALRGIGMNMVNKTDFVKTVLAKQAMGL